MSKFFITNAIPYVNAKPHIGHALEFIQSDVIARYHKILGDEVLFLCGGDENAIKNVQAAEQAKVPVQEFIDKNTELFRQLAKDLNVSFDVWQKGSDPVHHKSSQELWKRCQGSGDIYKKAYTGAYCVGCELFYEKEELDEKGECLEHPGKKLEQVSEENYFFKLSKYEQQLLKIIESNKLKIIPESRKNEALSFIKQGLKDISISRTNARAKNWGVDVPGDPAQKIYVWFDGLNIYQSGVGFGLNETKYKKWWPADVHVIGKGILRFHAIYWPAFLLSAKLSLPKALFIHEYITVNGQKMSKTLGNVVDPQVLIDKYGAETLRYFFLRHISPFVDGDFSEEKLREVYNADLANGIGNLVARVAKLCEQAKLKNQNLKVKITIKNSKIKEYREALEAFRFNDALSFIWAKIKELDQFIDQEKPWELIKSKKLEVRSEKLEVALAHAVDQIQEIAALLEPFLPETAAKIEQQFKGPKIKSENPLFPRIN